MRILYCLDGTNLESVGFAKRMLSENQPNTVGILHVIDTSPRDDIARTRERFLRRPVPPPIRDDEMRQTESSVSHDILNEGLGSLPGAETLERRGHPEREIVNCAAEWRADLVIVCARAQDGGKPAIGPKSVGHVARFVLDHAPCPVLLLRGSTKTDETTPN